MAPSHFSAHSTRTFSRTVYTRINSSTCRWGKAYKLLGVIAPNWLRPNDVYIFFLSYFVEYEGSLYWKCCKCFVFHSMELPIGWNNKKNNRRRDIFIQSYLANQIALWRGGKCRQWSAQSPKLVDKSTLFNPYFTSKWSQEQNCSTMHHKPIVRSIQSIKSLGISPCVCGVCWWERRRNATKSWAGETLWLWRAGAGLL